MTEQKPVSFADMAKRVDEMMAEIDTWIEAVKHDEPLANMMRGISGWDGYRSKRNHGGQAIPNMSDLKEWLGIRIDK